ncbi:MAG: response regulator transcription factor [Thermoanaerobaculia bacterium]|nr:response regulator transcription factor [Thermoanaerobaculia bacterium]
MDTVKDDSAREQQAGSLGLLLVDDHQLFRKGIAALLRECEGMQVVGEAGDGQDALSMVASLQPDVVLLDLSLPGLVGTEVARRIRSHHPEIKVIVLSMHTDEEHVARCLEIGVSGYLLKSSSAAELEIAIRAAMSGDTYLTPSVSRGVISQFLAHSANDGDPLSILTSRQTEVLQLIAEGCSTREISQRLNVSVKTVESHRANIMDRLDEHDLAGLVRFAVRTGLV